MRIELAVVAVHLYAVGRRGDHAAPRVKLLLLLQLLVSPLLLQILNLGVYLHEAAAVRLSTARRTWYGGMAAGRGHGGHVFLHRGIVAHGLVGAIHSRFHPVSFILVHQLSTLTLLAVEVGEVELQAVAEVIYPHVEELLEVIVRRHGEGWIHIVPAAG